MSGGYLIPISYPKGHGKLFYFSAMLTLAHICLNVRDIERSLEFYQKLGFKPKFKFTRNGKHYGHYLEIAPNNYIEMFELPAQSASPSAPEKSAAAKQPAGIAHFCLESEDIDALIKDLDSKDIAHTEKKLGCDNTYQIWLKDPDGNDFEVHQYTSKSLQKIGGEVEADW